jgi:hypothetical protein
MLDYGIKHEIARICELTEILSELSLSLSLLVRQTYLRVLDRKISCGFEKRPQESSG